jgi:hypothetical protein
MSAIRGNPEDICSREVLLSLTQLGHGACSRSTRFEQFESARVRQIGYRAI